MTSLFDWLPILWARNGTVAKKVHRFLLAILAGYVGLIVVSVLFSAFGLQQVNWMIFTIYLFAVLALPLHPILWEALTIAGYVRGQIGGEDGLDVSDGVDKVVEWAVALIKNGGLILLFYGSVPFIWTAINSTYGAVGAHLVLLPLVLPLVYFWVIWAPNSKFVFALIGYALTGLFLWNLTLGGYNTIQRKVADPSTLILLEHQQVREQEAIEREARVTKDLQAQLDRGEAFTAEQKAVWSYLQQKRQTQSLRLKDLKSNVEEFVGEANPTDKSWWKQYWPLVGGLVIGGIALAIYSRRRLAGGSGTAVAGTTVAAPAGAHAPAKKKGWVGKVFLILLAGGLGYLYVTERIWYSKERDVMIEHLGDQQVCGLPADAWLTFRVVNPVVVYAGRPGERPSPYTLTDSFRMVRDLEETPKRFAHPGEVFRTNQFGCTAWSFPMDEGFRKVAIVTELGQNRRSVLLHFESVAPWRWHK